MPKKSTKPTLTKLEIEEIKTTFPELEDFNDKEVETFFMKFANFLMLWLDNKTRLKEVYKKISNRF